MQVGKIMDKKLLIVTNNKIINDTMSEKSIFIDICFSESSSIDVFNISKSRIRDGYILLTHPFRGAIEPLEQPFKSLILKEGGDAIDFDSLKLINHCIMRFRKAISERPANLWTKKDLTDFAKVDVIIIERWLRKVYYKQ